MRFRWLLLPLLAVGAFPATAPAASLTGVGAARIVSLPNLPPRADRDGDGLANAAELHRIGTSPFRFDTDGDGFGDGAEMIAGSNPLDRSSVPVLRPPIDTQAGGTPVPPVETPGEPEEEEEEEEVSCGETLAHGEDLAAALTSASGGDVICLESGTFDANVSGLGNTSMVTVRPSPGASPKLDHSVIDDSRYLRFRGLEFTGGAELLGPSSHIQFLHNEFTAPFGIHANGQQQSLGTQVTDVLIEGNDIHDLDYSGSQGTANGYGVTASNGVARFQIVGNTIKSPASDYIQTASPVDFKVDRNTFLGPSLLGTHNDHQDLWQIFGGGTNITFTNNVARHTETQESLLFQTGLFENVVIENNLFDHDSRGYTCQIYQSTGLVFRDNTVVGSHWGCLFRDDPGYGAGSGYQVDHNVFAATEENADVSTEGRADAWGNFDYNVSSDGSAAGAHSLLNWTPSWLDTTSYVPLGLPFAAGYRP